MAFMIVVVTTQTACVLWQVKKYSPQNTTLDQICGDQGNFYCNQQETDLLFGENNLFEKALQENEQAI